MLLALLKQMINISSQFTRPNVTWMHRNILFGKMSETFICNVYMTNRLFHKLPDSRVSASIDLPRRGFANLSSTVISESGYYDVQPIASVFTTTALSRMLEDRKIKSFLYRYDYNEATICDIVFYYNDEEELAIVKEHKDYSSQFRQILNRVRSNDDQQVYRTYFLSNIIQVRNFTLPTALRLFAKDR